MDENEDETLGESLPQDLLAALNAWEPRVSSKTSNELRTPALDILGLESGVSVRKMI